MYSEEQLLPLSGLQHLAYCERQYALIHIEQVWEESADTLRGEFFHERVDTAGYVCASGVRSERRVRLSSSTLGLYGMADIVEFEARPEGERITPVEYKVGKPKRRDWDRIQVTAQAMCLEEMYGTAVDEGYLFYGETRHREKVEVGAELRERVAHLSNRMHELFDSRSIPTMRYGRQCKRCSLLDVCMPTAIEKDVRLYWEEMGEGW